MSKIKLQTPNVKIYNFNFADTTFFTIIPQSQNCSVTR